MQFVVLVAWSTSEVWSTRGSVSTFNSLSLSLISGNTTQLDVSLPTRGCLSQNKTDNYCYHGRAFTDRLAKLHNVLKILYTKTRCQLFIRD